MTGSSDARLKRHALIVWSGSRLLAVWFHTVYQLACPGEIARELWHMRRTNTGHARTPARTVALALNLRNCTRSAGLDRWLAVCMGHLAHVGDLPLEV